jgi:glycosyltransferase involved in cell wall biosynthesis
MSAWPRVSIIIPTRNRARYLKRGLDRLLECDYPNLEVIVMDGASTDGTAALLASYGPRLTRWVSEKDGGEYDAANKGAALASGEIIKFMSDDDVLLPQSVEIASRYFLAHPEVDVVFGQQRVFQTTPHGDVLVYDKPILDRRSLTLRNWIRRSRKVPSNIASFIRKRALDEVGGFSTTIWPGDVEFWARVARRGRAMALLPDHFVDYYLTGDNGVLTQRRKCQTVFYHTARLHGSRADILYVLWFKIVLFELSNPVRALAHKLDFHPRRWWMARRAGKGPGLESDGITNEEG